MIFSACCPNLSSQLHLSAENGRYPVYDTMQNAIVQSIDLYRNHLSQRKKLTIPIPKSIGSWLFLNRPPTLRHSIQGGWRKNGFRKIFGNLFLQTKNSRLECCSSVSFWVARPALVAGLEIHARWNYAFAQPELVVTIVFLRFVATPPPPDPTLMSDLGVLGVFQAPNHPGIAQKSIAKLSKSFSNQGNSG